jgi:Glucodextranase, domain B/PASTA domain
MRRSLLALLAMTVLSACGEDRPQPPRPEPAVELVVGSPADAVVVRAETVEIRGTVRPARARVEVLGRQVGVTGGTFTAEVPLEPGANLIDVAASAGGRRPDFEAMRVVREERVAVPDVIGIDADTAQDQLEALGLKVKLEDAGGFFDPILPGDPRVCDADPAPGAQVLPGSQVALQVARDC